MMQVEFYDKRYQEGYMEAWDQGKIQKVKEILRSMPLPQTGKALDFGCGNGVFTAILKEMLPAWDVWGTDISDTALQNAQKRLPSCQFFPLQNSAEYSGQFDFIFSHHVIEHVDHINESFAILNRLSAPKAWQLHILPCGNPNSLEHAIASSIKGGIEEQKEYRFFFEEPGHLRRLTSEAFEAHMKVYGFSLFKAFFSNQYWGAVNWITKSSPRFVKKLTDISNAIDLSAVDRLKKLRKQLLPLTYAQHALVLFLLYWNRYNRKPKETLAMILCSFPALISWPLYQYLDRKANEEWSKEKMNPNGSEMFLIFNR